MRGARVGKRTSVTVDIEIGENWVAANDAAFVIGILPVHIVPYITDLEGGKQVVTFENIRRAARVERSMSEPAIDLLMKKFQQPLDEQSFEQKMLKLVDEFAKKLEDRLEGRETDRIRAELKDALKQKRRKKN